MMKLIKINEEHYVIVDDSQIKEGDYVLSKLNEIVVFGSNYTPSLYKRITHSTEPLEIMYISGVTMTNPPKIFKNIKERRYD